MFSEDLLTFEDELRKEPYEMFVELCKFKAEDGKYSLSIHALRKLGYIPTSGTAKTKMEELVNLASSYDKDGIYTVCSDGVCYEEVIKTDIAGVSFVSVEGDKTKRAKQCASGFEFYETAFEELADMLQEDFAYTPFRLKDGIRGKDNIIGGCKFIVFDIDTSRITDTECHLLLEGINHHIARTSDKENPFKFRLLIELDTLVEVEDRQWKYFIEDISKDLGLTVDLLPKSQIYFSYSDREVLSELEGKPLEAKDYILSSASKLANKPKPKKLTTAQQKTLLDDPLTTFEFAYMAPNGSGSRAMIRAVLYAKDLGASTEYMLDLVNKINDYWLDSMPDTRLEAILNQVRRL
jgi:hypothetical protein